MKTLIIPDVHDQISKVQAILQNHYIPGNPVVFLGDWFDSFGGLGEPKCVATCEWLAANLHNPDFTFLLGNHDASYAYDKTCSGYSVGKRLIINSFFTKQVFDEEFKLFTWVESFLCSHAGLHQVFLDKLPYKLSLVDKVNSITKLTPGILEAGKCRGGYNYRGGITWLDFNEEFYPVSGLNQIVGHTKGYNPRRKGVFADSCNWCLDTELNHVGVVEEGKLTILETKWC